jgi:hypothetical protein
MGLIPSAPPFPLPKRRDANGQAAEPEERELQMLIADEQALAERWRPLFHRAAALVSLLVEEAAPGGVSGQPFIHPANAPPENDSRPPAASRRIR